VPSVVFLLTTHLVTRIKCGLMPSSLAGHISIEIHSLCWVLKHYVKL